MSLLIQYLLKVSISLGVAWLFYRFVLRRLTFYTSNRWYLLSCTLLSFLIPFINIAPALENNEGAAGGVVRFIPAVQQYTIALEEAARYPVPIWSTGYDKWDWMAFGLMAGGGFFLLRFITRFISFFRMRYRANLVSAGKVRVYQVDKDIIPFSFGRSIFINHRLHGEAELQEIIRHEFVHVKQKHTCDIICTELLCILNWYNPFAWLIRRATRQNLEFIADHRVLENGLDKKQYQYLLLKVIGNHHFSIANQFNFSSLKKRIAMMNKMRSARAHLLKFLFLLPLVAVCLLAFRNNTGRETGQDQDQIISAGLESPDMKVAPVVDTAIRKSAGNLFSKDTVPGPSANKKGYHITIADNSGNCMVVIKDKNNKEVEQVLLTTWNENKSYYENRYGLIHPPPPPIEPPPARPAAPAPPTPPPPPAISGLPGHVRSIQVDNSHAVVLLKNGEKEDYDLGDVKQKAAFQKKYGKELPAPPLPPAAPKATSQTLTIVADSITWAGSDRTLSFTGRAFIDDSQGTISADLVNMKQGNGLVIINGREADTEKDYINVKGGTYKVTSLSSGEAIKKYGEKGKNGALEIDEIAGR